MKEFDEVLTPLRKRLRELVPSLQPVRARHGTSLDRICAQPDRDYPGDTDLVFERGSQGSSVRLTPQDRTGVMAALFGPLAAPAFVAGYLAVLAGDFRFQADPEDAAALARAASLVAGLREGGR